MKTIPSSLVAAMAVTLSAYAGEPRASKPVTPLTPPTAKASSPASEPKNVTPDDAEKLIQTRKDLVVLDVRTAEEFEAGHIHGAKNISLLDDDFEKRIKEVEGKPVLVHCASGSRSAKALKQMLGKGFPELYHMNGGMKAWQDAGKPVEKSSASTK